MTAVSTPLGTATAHKRATITPTRLAMDVWLLAERNLLKIWRRPRLIVFSIVQPIMQLILFVFVFGAIANLGDAGLTYKDFVVPAVLVQTMVFAGIQSGIGIADDMNTGMIDRFRSLPVARSGFLLGRTVSDGIRLSLQATMVTVVAFIIGFHTHNGVGGAVLMVVVAILFGIALVTFSEYMGLAIKDPETVQAAVFIPLLPLIFTSSAFAPVSRLPGLDATGRAGEPGDVRHRHRPWARARRRRALQGEPGAPLRRRDPLRHRVGRDHGVVHVPRRAPVSQGLNQLQSARSRVFLAFAAGTVAVLVVAWFAPWQVTVLVGWDVAALLVLLRVWTNIWFYDSAQTREWAMLEDDTRPGAELLLIAAGLVSLVGVGFAFLKAEEQPGYREVMLEGLGILTIILSWLLVHTMFALRYAHLYYTQPDGGIDYKQGPGTSPTTRTSRTPRSLSA